MHRNIIYLSVVIAVCGGFSPVAAQTASSATVTTAASKTKKIEVKDYKGFKSYIENEQAKLKTKPLTIENGTVKDKLKKIGLEFSPARRWAHSKDGEKTAYPSPDKKGISVVNNKLQQVEIYNANGTIIRKVPFSKYPAGAIAFSDARLFLVKEDVGGCFGFEIYNFSGELFKNIDKECVDGYVVSNKQKYFAVTSGSPKIGDYFVLYNMDGDELWRKKVVLGGKAEIQFSSDDKFAIVKMPIYWEGTENKSRKERKLYLFDIENKKIISEENYGK
ncbi:MAG: hypothetical protein Q7R35_12445 [Elusimicrobiota bacterium]|nr:hypothetical protein [Elusimicrobiota bacterium]